MKKLRSGATIHITSLGHQKVADVQILERTKSKAFIFQITRCNN